MKLYSQYMVICFVIFFIMMIYEHCILFVIWSYYNMFLWFENKQIIMNMDTAFKKLGSSVVYGYRCLNVLLWLILKQRTRNWNPSFLHPMLILHPNPRRSSSVVYASQNEGSSDWGKKLKMHHNLLFQIEVFMLPLNLINHAEILRSLNTFRKISVWNCCK